MKIRNILLYISFFVFSVGVSGNTEIKVEPSRFDGIDCDYRITNICYIGNNANSESFSIGAIKYSVNETTCGNNIDHCPEILIVQDMFVERLIVVAAYLVFDAGGQESFSGTIHYIVYKKNGYNLYDLESHVREHIDSSVIINGSAEESDISVNIDKDFILGNKQIRNSERVELVLPPLNN